MRISKRLVLNSILIAVVSVVITGLVVGILAYYMAGQSLKKTAKEQLISIRAIKTEQIQTYFQTIENQLLAMADNPMVINAMIDFKKGFYNYQKELGSIPIGKYKTELIRHYTDDFSNEYDRLNGNQLHFDGAKLFNFLSDRSFALQYNYIIQNPNQLHNKDNLTDAKDGTTYNESHKKFHPAFRDFLKRFDYHDIILVDSDTGEVVYTVFKELDFTTSLKNGPFANTALGHVFKAANDASKPGYITITDFVPYLPSYNNQAAFMATPIYDKDKKIGVLIFQIPIGVINNIMTNQGLWKEVGLGKSGETYLVGSDATLRSPSRFFIEEPEAYLNTMRKIGIPVDVVNAMKAKNTSIGLQPINTEGASLKALKGETGVGIFKDYRDVSVLSAYAPLNIPGLNWAIVAKIDEKEAFGPVWSLGKKIIMMTLIVSGLLMLIAAYMGMLVAKNISQPIEEFSEIIRILASEQDLTKRVKVESEDEFQDMADALNEMLSSFQQAFQQTLDSSRIVQEKAKELEEISQQIVADSEEDIDNHAEKLSSTHKELNDLSKKIEEISKNFNVL